MITQMLSLKRGGKICWFEKWMIYIICFGLVLWGLPINRIWGAEERQVHRIVIDQFTGPNPTPEGFKAGEGLQFKARVLDERGYSIEPNDPACGGIVFEIPQTIAGQVLFLDGRNVPITPGAGGLPRVGQQFSPPPNLPQDILPLRVGNAQGGQPIEAYCRKQPSIKGRKIVTAGTGTPDNFDRPPQAREYTPPPTPAKDEFKGAAKDAPPEAKPAAGGGGAGLAIVAGVVAGAALIAVAAAAGGAGGGGGGGGGSSSNCHCSSSSYYCSASWGTACCSHTTCSSPYYASNGLCYCSIFSMPSNVRYVMCGGC